MIRFLFTRFSTKPTSQASRASGVFYRTQATFSSSSNTSPSVVPKEMPKIEYKPHSSVLARSEEEIKAFMEKHDIKTIGKDVPRPVLSFEETNFPATVLRELSKAKFPEPSSIQAMGWPMAMSGRDMVGKAETGSGKTLAYILPAIVHIKEALKAQAPARNQNSGFGRKRESIKPPALILAPTRELASQIHQECVRFGATSGIESVVLYGGASQLPQIKRLMTGRVSLIVATPGRLIDMVERGYADLSGVTYLVMDEADRMLDMGFEPQIRQIVDEIGPVRQTLMWSATWPKEVMALANKYLKDFIQVNVGPVTLQASKNITQNITILPNSRDKFRRLESLLEEIQKADGKNTKILVFTSTKRDASLVAELLENAGHRTAEIHGDKSQSYREQVLYDFKNGKIDIVVATDVAARGIDIKGVNHVVNYDMPTQIEDYIHRIGRTGRAGATGTSHSFVTNQDAPVAQKLVQILKDIDQKVPDELLELAKSSNRNQKGFRQNNFNSRPRDSFKPRESYTPRSNFFSRDIDSSVRGRDQKQGFLRKDHDFKPRQFNQRYSNQRNPAFNSRQELKRH